MSAAPSFDWKFLVTNGDSGITSIVVKIMEHLEPRDIHNFAMTSREVRDFVIREKANISKKYRSVILKFPRNDWNRGSLDSIWSRKYFTECISNTHNVIMEYSTNEEFTEVNMSEGRKGYY